MNETPGTKTVTVFVDTARVIVPAGFTVLDAVRAWNAERAGEVERGVRLVTDSRGLPTPLDAPVHGGAIFRLAATRDRQPHDDLTS